MISYYEEHHTKESMIKKTSGVKLHDGMVMTRLITCN